MLVLRFSRSARLIATAIWLLEAGCGSSGTKTPDAAGVDAAPDAATTDLGSSSDGTAVDVARDGGAGDVAGPPDGGGADGTDGGDGAGDLCNDPCLAKLVGGCLPAGTCVTQGRASCYSNGVKVVNSAPGSGAIIQTTYRDGVECATLEPGYTYRDPNGAVLGTLELDADGTRTITCTGEPTVVIPPDCPTIVCTAGTCN